MPTNPSSSQLDASVRTYVLDTSVLLADPGALKRFEEHEVVLLFAAKVQPLADRHAHSRPVLSVHSGGPGSGPSVRVRTSGTRVSS